MQLPHKQSERLQLDSPPKHKTIFKKKGNGKKIYIKAAWLQFMQMKPNGICSFSGSDKAPSELLHFYIGVDCVWKLFLGFFFFFFFFF